MDYTFEDIWESPKVSGRLRWHTRKVGACVCRLPASIQTRHSWRTLCKQQLANVQRNLSLLWISALNV